MNICVFGASSTKLDKEYYTEAEALGELIAQNGHTLIFGGGTDGLMGSSALGAEKHGGHIVGIAPKFFDEPDILYKKTGELIFTDTMEQRKTLMLEKSDAFVALPGGIGTFEELFACITLKQLGRHSKPIVLVNTLNYYTPLYALIENGTEKGFIGRDCAKLIKLAAASEEAMKYISEYTPVTGSTKRICGYCR